MNTTTFLTSPELLTYWQGHRNLTRRVIETFPEKELFEFSIGGMRTFADLTKELLAIAAPGLKEIVLNEIHPFDEERLGLTTKEALLNAWDTDTELIDLYFNQISAERLKESHNLFGQYEFPIYQNILYFIENEIHHRGQGYVYLRSLGIEPPFFWDRVR
jgi:uncharacterized damage-inducible protein DinB